MVISPGWAGLDRSGGGGYKPAFAFLIQLQRGKQSWKISSLAFGFEQKQRNSKKISEHIRKCFLVVSCLNIASHHLKIEINSDLRAIMLLFTKFRASCIFDRGPEKT